MSIRTVFAAVLIGLLLTAGCEASSPTPTGEATVTPVPRSPGAAWSATPVPPTLISSGGSVTPVPPTPTPTLPPLSGSGGGRIVFSTNRHGKYELYIMNADGTDLRRLTRTSSHEEGSAACSPDGSQIAFGSNRQNQTLSEIGVINADGAEQGSANVRWLTTTGGDSPTWSPDGTRIAYSRETRLGCEIYVMGANGTHAQRLTTADINATSPHWSPDGTQMVCVVDSDPDFWNAVLTIYVLNVRDIPPGESASSAHLRPLPRPGDPYNDWPAWSPTGSQIAFGAVVDGQRDIYVVDADGTNLRPLTQTKDFDEMAPAWSPDGTQIVFMANPDAHWDIYVMAVPDEPATDTTGWHRLTTDVANDVDPCWCP